MLNISRWPDSHSYLHKFYLYFADNVIPLGSGTVRCWVCTRNNLSHFLVLAKIPPLIAEDMQAKPRIGDCELAREDKHAKDE